MGETNESNDGDKKNRVKRQPKTNSVLTPTFAASRYSTSSNWWDDGHQQGNGLLQRQCACGTHTIGGDTCDTCRKEQEFSFLQRAAIISGNQAVRQGSHPQVRDDETALTFTASKNHLAYNFSQIPLHAKVEPDVKPEPAVGTLRNNNEQASDHTESVLFRFPDYAKQVQRETAKSPDPLCENYVYIVGKMFIEFRAKGLKAAPGDVEKRMELIRGLKWIWRCATPGEKSEIKSILKTNLGEKTATTIWKEAGTPFGGYRGAYPGYYGGAKGRLKRLGMSIVEAFDSFAFNPRSDPMSDFNTSGEAAATTEAPVMEAVDILYFYGHQYAQYNFPGVFANGTQTRFIDLKALAGKGDFSRVKLIISTSCATCCKEAIETFTPLFPNAVILGYRKSAPSEGEAVRNAFDRGIQGLKRPLLLNEPVDVNAIIGVWKSVIKRFHPNEKTRLPGYYQGGTVHYLEKGTWKSMSATDAGNSCRKKGGAISEAAH